MRATPMKKPPCNKIEKFSHNGTKNLYTQRFKHYTAKNPITQNDCPGTRLEIFKENIYKSKEAIGTCTISQSNKRNKTSWFSKKIKTITRPKKEEYIKYRVNDRNREIKN